MPPRRWMRPTIDSLMPRRSPGDAGRVEAAPGVAHEPGQLGLVGLDEHVDPLDAGVAGGVDDGLADRGDERPRRVVERLVADDDGLDADVVVGLDRHGQGVDRRVQRRRLALAGRCRRARPAARAPGGGRGSSSAAGRSSAGSARATAAPSRGGGRPRRPLVLADARRPLVVEPPQQPPERRGGEDRQAADDDGDGAGRRADAGQAAGAVGQRGRRRRRAGRRRATTWSDAGDRAADRRPAPTAERPDDEMPTATAAAGIMIPSPGHSPIAGRRRAPPPSRTPMASSRRQRSAFAGRGAASARRHRWTATAADAVQHHAEPAGQRQQPDRGAHDRRLDAPPVGPPAGHAGDRPGPTRAARAGGRTRGARPQSLA